MKKGLSRYLLPFALAGGLIAVAAPKDKSHDAAVTRNLNIFNSLVKELELNYVDSIRTDESFEMAIDAMLSTVDPYTEFYTTEEKEQLETMTTGEYGGIGSYIMERDGDTYIMEPYEGSPAAVGGLKTGDRIISVDTTKTHGLKSSEVTKLLRGVPGTPVEIKVMCPFAEDSIKTITIDRKKLQLPSVPYYGIIGDHIGYIKLTSFMDKSAAEVKEALESFRKDPQLKGIILDLTDNGGGLLEAAVDIVGYFVPKGTEVLRTRGKDVNSEKIYKTTRNPVMPDTPLAVLIDGGSASASEITAGALQDLDRAVLVGGRSFGKGLVQSTRPLPYSTLLKVTVAKYYIPSGRLIQALDYSRRNEDGSVARTPDSLTNVFHTRAGREVRDGGGLKPDIEVKWDKGNRLVYNIVADHWGFDYATRFAAGHDTIAPPETFAITDEIFNDFKASIDPKRFKYDKACEDMVDQLEKTAENEGYMNDSVKNQIAGLKKLLTHNLDKDLDRNRGLISEFLLDEILGRYYYEKGKIIGRLKTSKEVAEAEKLLSDPERYKSLLSAPKKK